MLRIERDMRLAMDLLALASIALAIAAGLFLLIRYLTLD